MKLYSADLSPYAARARMAVYAKGCPVDIAAPPGGKLQTPEYLAINPLGKIPTLVLDDGTAIPESQTIVEYLEDRFPEKPLRPADAEGRARVRIIERLAEVYVADRLQILFGQLNPKTRDQAVVDDQLDKLETGLGHLNRVMGDGPYADAATLTTADCEVLPFLFYVNVIGGAMGRPDMMAGHDKVAAYWAFMNTDELGQKVVGELARGLAAFRPAA